MLLDLEDQIGPPPFDGPFVGMTAHEILLALYWPPFRMSGQLPKGLAASPTLTPIVNRGRWIVMCPFCPSANRASRKDRRFFCCECGNTKGGGQWLPVVWPAHWAEIEAALEPRDRVNQHWTTETVAQLLEENALFPGAVLI